MILRDSPYFLEGGVTTRHLYVGISLIKTIKLLYPLKHMLSTHTQASLDQSWYLDIGASHHITSDWGNLNLHRRIQ